MNIQTERLLIRSFAEADIPAYAEIVADPRVMRYLGDGQPHSHEEAARYLRDCIALEAETGMARYAVLLGGELIGFCGFKPEGEHIDFGTTDERGVMVWYAQPREMDASGPS